jgi:hypothetical protein
VRLATGQIRDEFRIVGDNRETWYVTSTVRYGHRGIPHGVEQRHSTAPSNGDQRICLGGGSIAF